MNQVTEAFNPNKTGAAQIESANITASGTSGNVAVVPGTLLRLINTHASQLLYINFGPTVAVTAQAGDLLIPPVNGKEFIRVPSGCFFMAHFASGASTVFNLARGF